MFHLVLHNLMTNLGKIIVPKHITFIAVPYNCYANFIQFEMLKVVCNNYRRNVGKQGQATTHVNVSKDSQVTGCFVIQRVHVSVMRHATHSPGAK